MSTAADYRQKLIDEGLYTASELWLGSLPDTPDTAIALVDDGGPPMYHFGPENDQTFDSYVNVFVRTDKYSTASDLAETITRQLEKLGYWETTDNCYHAFFRRTSPTQFNPDSERRYIFVTYARAIRSEK